MAHRIGTDRNQLHLLPPSLDEHIGDENPAKVLDAFVNSLDDRYTCPEGQKLSSNGKWYKKFYRTHITLVKQYKTKACRECKKRCLCTSSPIERGRLIERSQYQDSVDANNLRVRNEKGKYLLRQTMSEHPFGIIKRQWGYDHVMMKGFKLSLLHRLPVATILSDCLSGN